jgi:hypothetical protein
MVMIEPIVFGLDPGNSEATGVIARAGKAQFLTIPSDIGAGSLTQLTRIRGGAGQQRHLAPDEHVLEVDGSSWFVGALALEQSTTASSARGDVARYWSGHTLRLLMVLAGTLIGEPSFTLRVVTGLPVMVWDTTTTVPHVQRSLCGTHAFRLNGQERVMTVTGVMVVMEGAGALAVHGLADDVPQAVIDIGGRTTELFWAHGQRPLLPRCSGFDRGVGDVGDALAAAFLEQHRRALTPREVRESLRAIAQGRPHPPLFVDGQSVQLGELVARAVRDIGADIRSQISRTWRSSEQGKVAAEAARVLLIGGGAYYFAPALRALIPHLQVPKHAEHANAQGYLAIGSQLPERAWARLHG